MTHLGRHDNVEGAFQKAWDRSLTNAPVLLIVIGSDLAMMELLTEYGRPLYGRPLRKIDLQPLNPSDIASITGLSPVDAFDAFLVTGGRAVFVVRARSIFLLTKRKIGLARTSHGHCADRPGGSRSTANLVVALLKKTG
jgi:hypothetical protein